VHDNPWLEEGDGGAKKWGRALKVKKGGTGGEGRDLQTRVVAFGSCEKEEGQLSARSIWGSPAKGFRRRGENAVWKGGWGAHRHQPEVVGKKRLKEKQ